MSEQERRIASEQESNETTIRSLNAEADSYENQIATLADEPGNGKAIASLTRKLSDLAATLRIEENKKAYLADQRERAKAQTRTAQPAGDDTGGQRLADGRDLSGFSPQVQAWFRQHPEVFSDKAYLNRVIAWATSATNVAGHQAGTRAYFDYVDRALEDYEAAQGGRDGDEGEEIYDEPRKASPYSGNAKPTEDVSERVEEPQHRAAGPGSMAAARPTRTIPGNAGGGARRGNSLTAEEREVADALYAGMSPVERYAHYAENKTFMAKQRPGQFGAN